MGKFMIFMNFHYSNLPALPCRGKKRVRDEFVTAHCQLVFCVFLVTSPLLLWEGSDRIESSLAQRTLKSGDGNIMKLTIKTALKTSPNNRRMSETKGVSLSERKSRQDEAERNRAKGFKMTTIKFYEFRCASGFFFLQ
jgi:hypothetical protein